VNDIHSCPNVQVLQRLLLGQLPAAEAEALAEHLENCLHCSSVVPALIAPDPLAEAVRAQSSAAPVADADAIGELVERLQRQGPPLSDPGTAAPSEALSRQTTLGPATKPAEPRKDRTAEVYAYLAPPQGPDEIGRLGGYRVLRMIGAGGMGVVFQAEDPQLGRLVALKVMRPGLASDAVVLKRFLREARAMGAIKHDHVLTVYQVGEERSVPFFAAELLEGESLEDRLRRVGHLPVAEVLRIGREMAEGLAAAHERGLVHRDVKPANVWLEQPRGRVKVLDFGLARNAREDAKLTKQGTILGTPSYMAPEQARGGTVDPRTDLFSLGCVLYRACTGRLPFQGDDKISILLSVNTEDPPPPVQVCPDVPAGLSDLVMRLLAKKPEDRPQSAAAVVAALHELERPPAPPHASARLRWPLIALLLLAGGLLLALAGAATYRLLLSPTPAATETRK
jgi:hypothetical protein